MELLAEYRTTLHPCSIEAIHQTDAIGQKPFLCGQYELNEKTNGGNDDDVASTSARVGASDIVNFKHNYKNDEKLTTTEFLKQTIHLSAGVLDMKTAGSFVAVALSDCTLGIHQLVPTESEDLTTSSMMASVEVGSISAEGKYLLCF